MRITSVSLSAAVASVVCAGVLLAQSPAPPTFAPAPAGFDARGTGVPAGKVERIEFPSSVTNTKRPAMVYTPPGYSTARKYPVLYLLHGIGGNETHWTRFGAADAILDRRRWTVPLRIVAIPAPTAAGPMVLPRAARIGRPLPLGRAALLFVFVSFCRQRSAMTSAGRDARAARRGVWSIALLCL